VASFQALFAIFNLWSMPHVSAGMQRIGGPWPPNRLLARDSAAYEDRCKHGGYRVRLVVQQARGATSMMALFIRNFAAARLTVFIHRESQ
jgi:hypothetical protein